MVSLYKELQKSQTIFLPFLENFISVKDLNIIILEYSIEFDITMNHLDYIIHIDSITSVNINGLTYFKIIPTYAYSGNNHTYVLSYKLFNIGFSYYKLKEQIDSWIIITNNEIQKVKLTNNNMYVDASTILNKDDLITNWNCIWYETKRHTVQYILLNFSKKMES